MRGSTISKSKCTLWALEMSWAGRRWSRADPVRSRVQGRLPLAASQPHQPGRATPRCAPSCLGPANSPLLQLILRVRDAWSGSKHSCLCHPGWGIGQGGARLAAPETARSAAPGPGEGARLRRCRRGAAQRWALGTLVPPRLFLSQLHIASTFWPLGALGHWW